MYARHLLRLVTRAAVAILLLFSAASALGQACCMYKPHGHVVLVVTDPPGTVGDALARILSLHLKSAWGTEVIVENLPGPGGVLASGKVAKARADGRTFLVSSVQHHILYPNVASVPLSPVRELMPVAKLARVAVALVVPANSPVKTLSHLLFLAKQRPGTLTYGSPGVGSLPHMLGEQFRDLTGVNVVHVPFKGLAPAVQEVSAARVDLAFLPAYQAAALEREGKLRALAVSGKRRYFELEKVATFEELSKQSSQLRGELDDYWWGAFAPLRADMDDIRRASNDIRSVLKSASREMPRGVEIDVGSPDDFGRFVKEQHSKWTDLSRRATTRKVD